MSEHYKKVCRECGDITEQCICPDEHKKTIFVVCDKCEAVILARPENDNKEKIVRDLKIIKNRIYTLGIDHYLTFDDMEQLWNLTNKIEDIKW
jgi:hypothetical protein